MRLVVGTLTCGAMSLALTLALIAGFVVLGLVSAWRGARPPDLHRGPRMVPWRFLMLLSAMATLLLVVHLVNLFGATTGRG